MERRFERGDCDRTGIERYNLNAEERQTHDDEVVIAQGRLVEDGFLTSTDIDGNVGNGTLNAIREWERERERDFYEVVFGMPPVVVSQLDPIMIPKVAHTCQAWYNIDLCDGEPCRKSGCLSCCCEICWAVHDGRDIDVYGFITQMKQRGGYNSSGQIIWGVLEQLTGMEHFDRISLDEARNHIESGSPVMLNIGGHWVLGIGFDDRGFHAHDVGYRLGDCYKNPNVTKGKPTTYVLNENVVRVDVVI